MKSARVGDLSTNHKSCPDGIYFLYRSI